jgi:DNA-binding response OmpR family regulator
MPVMDGLEATTALRQMLFVGPIIGVTGNMMQEDVDHFLSVGATEVIGKPLKLDKLRELITGMSSSHLLLFPALPPSPALDNAPLELQDSTADEHDVHEDIQVIRESLSEG